MKKTVFAAVLSGGFVLMMFLGLPLFIYYMLDRHASAELGDSVAVVGDGQRALLVFPMSESHANSSGRGMVHSSSRDYAQLVDLDSGRLLWSRRLKAPDANDYDNGDGVLVAHTSRYLFFVRNALYVFAIGDGERIEGDGRLRTLTADRALQRVAWHPLQHALAVLDQQGRGWWIDTDSLQVRADDAMDPAALEGDGAIDVNGFGGHGLSSEVPHASGAVDADGSWWLLTSPAGLAALSAGRGMGDGKGLDLRRQLRHGRFDWSGDPAAQFSNVSAQGFIDGALLLDPRATAPTGQQLQEVGGDEAAASTLPPEPEFDYDPGQYASDRAYREAVYRYRRDRDAWRRLRDADRRQRDARRAQLQAQRAALAERHDRYGEALRDLQLRAGPVVAIDQLWTTGDGDWLVLHRRSGERDAELLLSALQRNGRVRWTLALGVKRLARLWGGKGQLLAQGEAMQRDSDRLLRVDLATGEGIGYGLLDRASAPLQRVTEGAGSAEVDR